MIPDKSKKRPVIDEPKIKKEAAEYLAKGKFKKALPLFLRLAEHNPRDLRLKTKVGDVLHKLLRKEEAAAVYRSVAAQYASEGMLIQAIAVNKLLLQLNPRDPGIQRELAALYSQRQAEMGNSPLGKIATVIRPIQIREVPTPDVKPEAASDGTAYYGSKPLEIQVELDPDQEALEITEEMEIPGRIIDFSGAVDLGAIAEVSLPPTLLFSDLESDVFERVLKVLKRRDLSPGEKVCEENSPGDSLFIVSEGQLSVTSKDTKAVVITIANLSEGDFFGEFGYFSDRKRHATVTSVGESVVLELARNDIDSLIGEYPKVGEVLQTFYRRRLLDILLAKSRIFRPLSAEERSLLVKRFQLETFEKDSIIVREGDEGDALYLIQEGSLEVSTMREGRKVVLAHMWDGNFFGEFAVFTGTKRTATITAVTPVKLLRLSKQAAVETLAQHEQIAQVLKDIYDERVNKTIQALTAVSTTLNAPDELKRGLV